MAITPRVQPPATQMPLEAQAPKPPAGLPASQRRRIGFAAGVAAGLVFVVAMLVVRLATGIPSLLEVLADGFLGVLPGAFFSVILDALQHAAKDLLYLGFAIGTVIVGGLIGQAYAAKPGWRRAALIAASVWIGFGGVIYSLLGVGAFGSGLQAGSAWHALSLLALCAVFAVALHEIFALLAERAAPSTAEPGRRRLVITGAGVGLLALAGGGAVWRSLASGTVFSPGAAPAGAGSPSGPLGPDAAQSAAPQPGAVNAAPYDLPSLSPEITTAKDFYTVSKNFIDPSVDAAGWSLKITGNVQTPLEITYDQLRALPGSAGTYALMCISNEVGGNLWGNAQWRGVSVKYLLDQAGVKDGTVKAMFTAADDYQDSVAVEHVLDPNALLAWEMNGDPLAKEHGFPARLLIPGIYGMKNVKWIKEISLITTDFVGYWQKQGWDNDAPYHTASRIDAPKSRAALTAGTSPVAGVAFAGNRGIQQVEVSADSGQTWTAAQVKPPLSPNAWQIWRADLDLQPSAQQLQVRATDGAGNVQIRQQASPFPSGSTGYDTIRVAVTSA